MHRVVGMCLAVGALVLGAPAAASAADLIDKPTTAGTLVEDVAFTISVAYTVDGPAGRLIRVTSTQGGGGECPATPSGDPAAVDVVSKSVSGNTSGTASSTYTYASAGIYMLCAYVMGTGANAGDVYATSLDKKAINVAANQPTITVTGSRLSNTSAQFIIEGTSAAPRTLAYASYPSGAQCSAGPDPAATRVAVAGGFRQTTRMTGLVMDTQPRICVWVFDASTGTIDGRGELAFDMPTPQACLDAREATRRAQVESDRLNAVAQGWQDKTNAAKVTRDTLKVSSDKLAAKLKKATKKFKKAKGKAKKKAKKARAKVKKAYQKAYKQFKTADGNWKDLDWELKKYTGPAEEGQAAVTARQADEKPACS